MRQSEKLAKLVRDFRQQVAETRIHRYEPYDWQREFHEAGADNPERMLMAANRVGKCTTYQTLIQTLNGETAIGRLFERAEPFDVWAFDGRRVVPARASAPFRKPGKHDCYRLFTRYGWIECADAHQLFLDGEWRLCEHLLEFGRIPLASSSEPCLSDHASGERHLTERPSNSQVDCLEDCRLCDGQPFSTQDSGQALSRRQGDARRHSAAWSHADDLVRKCTSSVQQAFGHLSIWDAVHRVEALWGAFADQVSCMRALPNLATPQGFQLLSTAEALDFQSNPEGAPQAPHDELWKIGPRHIPLLSANDIIAYRPIGRQECYDFEVEEHHNYLAGGLVNHNTMSAGAEVSYHLLGEYPDWWQGKRFTKPVLAWTGSPTNETSRDIVQAELLGGTGESIGTGWIPKAKILKGSVKTRQAGVKDVIEAFNVRHVSGGVSRCLLKTYEQGWKKWQGTAPHVVWMDEEPDDYKIFSESQTRVLTSGGIVLVTFTPLSGVTELVEHFRNSEPGEGIYWRGASWGDAPHLDEKERDRLRKRYRRHERKARTEGVPMMGEGAVFPVEDEDIAVDVFKIPDHFARIKGCDFGIDHPAAGVELAWDRDQDIVYVIDAYRKAGEKAPYHAAWFNKSNAMIPVAWPHDGMNREKTGGRTLAGTYRDHGVAMLPKSARYKREPGETQEKGGSQPVEPIVDEMLERMLTGRFKVFGHLNIFFDEKNSYHRKDGKIVDRKDDVLKACMYALMMKRHARSLSQLTMRRRPQAQRPVATVRIGA